MRDDDTIFEAAKTARVWSVGALVKALADTLDARFSPVAVRGEITNFSQAGSGHCYFSLKDEAGQIRCAMFRRAASLMDFQPKEGDLVELSARLTVYEPRGDLQLIVERIERAGQGAWFEQFLKLKAQLEREGCFDPARKRAIALAPRGIGLVTSRDAAALQDVATALARRAPHIPVWLAPASVQGPAAPEQLIAALHKLYHFARSAAQADTSAAQNSPVIDVILLVRGGGSAQDLAVFNNEALARAILQSPVPIISGIGHETDFTIADFVADLRAPTPTAAAELCAADRANWISAAQQWEQRLRQVTQSLLETQMQRVDRADQRLRRPGQTLADMRLSLQHIKLSLQQHMLAWHAHSKQGLKTIEADVATAMRLYQQRLAERHQRAEQALEHLSPQRVLERGYAMLQSRDGTVIKTVAQAKIGQSIQARLADGDLSLLVQENN